MGLLVYFCDLLAIVFVECLVFVSCLCWLWLMCSGEVVCFGFLTLVITLYLEFIGFCLLCYCYFKGYYGDLICCITVLVWVY